MSGPTTSSTTSSSTAQAGPTPAGIPHQVARPSSSSTSIRARRLAFPLMARRLTRAISARLRAGSRPATTRPRWRCRAAIIRSSKSSRSSRRPTSTPSMRRGPSRSPTRSSCSAEFLANRRKTYQNGWRQFWNFGYTGDLYGTGAGNALNFWADGWQGINLISPTGITNHSDSSQQVDYYRGVGGLRGSLGGKWRWEAYSQYSRNIGIYRTEQILQDAYDTGYFQTASCVGTVTPISGKNASIFPGPIPISSQARRRRRRQEFLFDWEKAKPSTPSSAAKPRSRANSSTSPAARWASHSAPRSAAMRSTTCRARSRAPATPGALRPRVSLPARA